MKFVYLFSVLLFIFSHVRADEEYDFDDDLEDDLYPRQYNPVPTPVKEPQILPPRPTYGYPMHKVEVSTIPSLKDKFEKAKKKIDQTKKKIEKDLKIKMESLKQKKPKKPMKPMKPKLVKTTTPEPVILYDRVSKKIIKKPKKINKSKECGLLYEALFG